MRRPLYRPAAARSKKSSRVSKRKAKRRKQWLAGAVELLRDHPLFEVPDPETGELSVRAALLAPAERQREWRRETGRLFKRRCGALTTVTAAAVPPSWLLYTFLAPTAIGFITAAQGLLLLCCLFIHIDLRRTKSLLRARSLTMLAYMVFGLCAPTIMFATRDLRIAAFSGHEIVLISLLFMPFSLEEAAVCAAFIVNSFAVGFWASLPAEGAPFFWPRVASLGFLAALISGVAFLQNIARRQAFDNAFDMALAASRGAALSNLDAVTGGYNRRHLETMLELEISRANRFKQPLSLVMFDLDNFKAVNDTNGHLAGDEVLREVLDATTTALRGIDTVARYGGDEFIVIFPGTPREAATGAAYRLRALVLERLREHFEPGSLESEVTLSLGVAFFAPGEVSGVDEAIERADSRLYQAKRLGKDCVFAG